jgi:hypothetical protein
MLAAAEAVAILRELVVLVVGEQAQHLALEHQVQSIQVVAVVVYSTIL